jgi:hypothetical protein
VKGIGSVVLALALLSGSPSAQAALARRLPDGQPDIQGLWSSGTGMFYLSIEPLEHLLNQGVPAKGLGRKLTIVVDPPTGILPYQPWALARRNQAMREFLAPSPAMMDPQTRGWPNGVPRENIYSSPDGSVGGPLQILQPPGYVLFLYETHHEFRIVPIGERPHPGRDIKLWMGDSRGRWEGDTLVLDVTNHNDSTRFDVAGNFHSDAMGVTERWTFVDANTLQYRATVDDPMVYTRPWTLAVTHRRLRAGTELFEYAGVEGDRDATMTAEAIRKARRIDK